MSDILMDESRSWHSYLLTREFAIHGTTDIGEPDVRFARG
jgi:hypothetical protein